MIARFLYCDGREEMRQVTDDPPPTWDVPCIELPAQPYAASDSVDVTHKHIGFRRRIDPTMPWEQIVYEQVPSGEAERERMTILRVIRDYINDCEGDIEGCDADELNKIEHTVMSVRILRKRYLKATGAIP